MSNQQQQQQGDDSGPIAFLMFMGFFAAVAFALWHYKSAPIVSFVMAAKGWQAWIISQFDPRYEYIAWWVKGRDPAQVTWRELQAFMSSIGSYSRWFVGAVFLGFAFWCIKYPMDQRYRRKLGLEGLMRDLSVVFPTIRPVCVENPLTDKSGRWARPLKAHEWVKKRAVACSPDGEPDWESAREAFAKDLGAPWRGAAALPPHLRAVVAAYALKAGRIRDKSKKHDHYTLFVNALATLWAAEGRTIGMDEALERNKQILADVDAVIAHSAFGGAADAVGFRHAYESTALFAIKNWAGLRGGVCAPADVLWLRVSNRPIWYALQNEGRLTGYPEGAAAMAHYKAEVASGHPLFEPAVDEAVIGLLEEMKFWPKHPEEQLTLGVSSTGGGQGGGQDGLTSALENVGYTVSTTGTAA